MKIKEITSSKNIKFYNASWARGYVSRKTDGWVEAYDGRYGKGYKIHRPDRRSTMYHIVEYYITANA